MAPVNTGTIMEKTPKRSARDIRTKITLCQCPKEPSESMISSNSIGAGGAASTVVDKNNTCVYIAVILFQCFFTYHSPWKLKQVPYVISETMEILSRQTGVRE